MPSGVSPRLTACQPCSQFGGQHDQPFTAEGLPRAARHRVLSPTQRHSSPALTSGVHTLPPPQTSSNNQQQHGHHTRLCRRRPRTPAAPLPPLPPRASPVHVVQLVLQCESHKGATAGCVSVRGAVALQRKQITRAAARRLCAQSNMRACICRVATLHHGVVRPCPATCCVLVKGVQRAVCSQTCQGGTAMHHDIRTLLLSHACIHPCTHTHNQLHTHSMFHEAFLAAPKPSP